MGCKIITNRHGVLTFRLSWQGTRYWKSTGRPDTPENRAYVSSLAAVISEAIKKGTFTLNWFEETNKPKPHKAKDEKPQTVGDYFKIWIERKKPPLVRPALARDYGDHFKWYILPKFETTSLLEVTPAELESLRTYLLNEGGKKGQGLSLKTVRNVIDATFRAMWRDARKVDYLVERDPFEALQWPRIANAKPDPFTEEERDGLIEHFKAKVPFYYSFLHLLFWTGMRPGEAFSQMGGCGS